MHWWHRIQTFVEKQQNPGQLVLIGSAMVIGAVTGVAAILFIWLLAQINKLALLAESTFGVIGLVGLMALAGLIVGFIIDRWAREAKGHGVPEVMEAIALRGGRIRARVAAMKVLASSITIGAGGSAGREGPIVQVGSALGSTLGQWLHFSDERIRMLVACGAAAGIAATFNAPIAGALFALEVILGRLTVSYFGAIVLSAVSASVVSQSLLGDKHAFQVPTYPLNHLGEIPIYALLGVLAALWAVLFIRLLYGAEDVFDRWSVPLPVKTAVGMALTGLTLLILPGKQVLGPGLELIGESIAEDFNLTLAMMGLLLVGKLLATMFTLGAGNSGGVFAPSLFMGAVLGGMVGTVGHSLWPEVVANPGAYAIVGMAAVFAGAARAPITAILIVFEMSGDYKLILPLMLATVLSTLLAEHLFSDSIYTLKLKMKNINWGRGWDQDVLHGVLVHEVMTKHNIETVPVNMPLARLKERFNHSNSHGLSVLDEQGKLWGVVTITDVERAWSDEIAKDTPISEFGTTWPYLKIVFADESIGNALARMSTRGLGRLPVVSREDPYELLGLIRRQDIIRAYDLALTRRNEIQARNQRMQDLKEQDNTKFVEIYLNESDPVVGQSVQSVADRLPHDCVLISIERNGHVIIPHGDTLFASGDHITAFTRVQDAASLFGSLHQS
ncbi:MAG: chloride channel protein [Chloroflexi bacterium]|nr:MAG: chloride channel protein [Chloroflexota bacterium]